MSPADPLFDTLFRPTTLAPAIASAAPVHQPGTRSRAGNAMSRTRGALLDGARRAVEVSGTKITMAQVAAAAGVAKATLYNHFRTRDAVLHALLVDEVTVLAAQFGEQPLPDALGGVANALADHPLLRTLARIEPQTLAALGCIDASAEGWRLAQRAVCAALAADSRGGADTVVRWLASYLLSPAGPASVAVDLAVLLAGLPDVPAQEPARSA
ncbi:MAG: TetR family transcriptional regulator [Jatrophihabitantaceae bacterium]